MSSESQVEAELATAQAELAELNEIEEADPSQFDDELKALQSDARASVERLERQLTETKQSRPKPPPRSDDEQAPPTPVTSAPTQEAQKRFQINDTVTARYAKDRQFYPATVVAVMGSALDPMYTIKFKGYPGTEKVRAHELRAISYQSSTNAKRKADDPPLAASGSTTATHVPGVLSAAPSIDPALVAAAKHQTSKSSDPSTAPPEKRLKKTAKKLEQGKQNWQNFKQSSSKGKAAKLMNKQSMFRTGDSATARVGFTGSGTAMREDAARSRHTYGSLDPNED